MFDRPFIASINLQSYSTQPRKLVETDGRTDSELERERGREGAEGAVLAGAIGLWLTAQVGVSTVIHRPCFAVGVCFAMQP